jgi:hypothetical protein
VLFKETGLDTEEMDRRYWDLAPHDGREVYVEIADLSTVAWGHINCDDITESWDIIGPGDDDQGDGGTKGLRGTGVLNRTDEHGESPAGKAFLMQNSPNPFNPNTRIVYEVPGTGRVTLRVYDVKGKLVRNLVDGEQEAGPHAITWNGRDETGRRAVTGVYLYRLTFAGEIVDTKKMLMLK